ncbi:OmpP1/FadL family transporter [Leptospira paudalimensis]|uniref:Outer membrane protein transport protein n=1 Tax=Leptospira paudalimensis TaxID=2950024 RepID=A0ABT3M7C1_9LEPT|nr:outer membrane protein transport protein [Leptospira paudalimensis]MCW7504292.1 outer membrane protein transport protein [Leptospira paudalimensis]
MLIIKKKPNNCSNTLKKLINRFILLSSICLSPVSLFPSEPFNNIQGFYGERAAGLAGAFTAIADDPSGAYYNPAGLGFTHNDGISISASNFKDVKRSYINIDTPGQRYNQTHQGFDPNFIGLLKNFDRWKFAFSIVNTYNYSYNRVDQVNYPLVSPSINSTRNYTKERYNQLLVGPSLAYLLNDKLSLGATLYYMNDTKEVSRTQFQQFSDLSYVMRSYVDNRRTSGLMPVLGIQYQPNPKLSLGFSYRRIFVTGGDRLFNEVYVDSTRRPGSSAVDFIEGTGGGASSIEQGVLTQKPKLVTSIPQTQEMRFGVAFFPTARFLASFDMIHTSGYKVRRNQDEISTFGRRVTYTINDTEVRELTRYSTTNFAAGMEYYLADTFSVLGGIYTNEPNTKPISWTESAVDLYLQNTFGNQVTATSGDASLIYKVARSGTNPRNEYSRNKGFSLGFSWVTSKSSVSVTYIRETGYGNSRIDPNSLAQSFEYMAQSIYIMVSSRN